MSAGRLARLPPLADAALAYGFGAALVLAPGARSLPIAAAFALAVLAALLALRAHPAAALAWLLAGVAATSIALQERTSDCRFAIADGVRVGFRGTLTTLPAADGDAVLRIEEADTGGCTGDVRARLGRGVEARPVPGAELRGHGRWLAAGWATRDPLYAGTLFIDEVDVLAAAGGGHHPMLALRGAAQTRVRALFGERAAVVEALVLARTEALDPEVRDRYARSGLAHLLSISGMHVGLLAGLLMTLANALGASPGTATGGAIAITWAYVLFLGAPAAAARAALMLTLFLAARLLQRPSRPGSVLAAAAIVLVACEPTVLARPGFQLSFAGVIGLIALSTPIARALPSRMPRWLRESLAGGLAATLATAPLSALHFQQIAPVGVIANLVAVPAMAAAVPAIGLCLAVSFLSSAAADFLAGGAGLLVGVLDRTAAVAAALPYGHAYVTADLAIALLLAAAAAAAMWSGAAAPVGPRRGVRRPVRRVAAAGVAAAVLLVWPAAARRSGNGALEIHVIDVGQGDAIALRTPSGAWALIDAGPRTPGWDAGARRVAPYLLRHHVRRLEALVVTHPDADHIGGAAAVEARIPVARVVDPGRAFGKDMHTALLEDARGDRRPWFAGDAGRTMVIDGVRLEFLHPATGLEGHWELNELSVVIRLEWRHFSALLTGDAGAPAERAVLERARRAGERARLRVDLLKVGHHGSRSSTTAELLEVARPAIAIIPVGRRNRYGHPHPTVIRRLADAGIRVYRTDVHGDIVLRVPPHAPPIVTTSLPGPANGSPEPARRRTTRLTEPGRRPTFAAP
ncbi:MAG TPA: DNA internalization-related competence protein ComEC/Rec2 [Longimicrobiales bacterium]|nr:DNA internalization-related competence protein ComEC/Rec2 [Longimicrobiales bacterium]